MTAIAIHKFDVTKGKGNKFTHVLYFTCKYNEVTICRVF